MMRFLTSALLLCVVLTACASSRTIGPQQERIVHVVLIWLHEPGNTEHIQQIIDASYRLKEISEIQEIRVGKSIPSDRLIVDDSFDVGLYMVFDSKAAMQRYLVHRDHKNAVKTILKPLSSKIQVYDFGTLEN